MKTFRLLISFDGALSVVNAQACDLRAAMDGVRIDNPGRTAMLVRVLS